MTIGKAHKKPFIMRAGATGENLWEAGKAFTGTGRESFSSPGFQDTHYGPGFKARPAIRPGWGISRVLQPGVGERPCTLRVESTDRPNAPKKWPHRNSAGTQEGLLPCFRPHLCGLRGPAATKAGVPGGRRALRRKDPGSGHRRRAPPSSKRALPPPHLLRPGVLGGGLTRPEPSSAAKPSRGRKGGTSGRLPGHQGPCWRRWPRG